MPQAVVIALMGAGMYAGFRLAKVLTARSERVTPDTSPPNALKEMGTLRRDPETGVYRLEA